MQKRREVLLDSQFGKKKLCVYEGDIIEYKDTINILTISAFPYHYKPVQGTMIHALKSNKGISVEDLAKNPKLDLRKLCGCWVSKKLSQTKENANIRRIGCIEMPHEQMANCSVEDMLLSRLQSYYKALDLLQINNVSVRHIAMPLLGTGNQKFDPKMIAYPMIHEAIQFLKRSPYTEEIVFIERRREKAELFISAIDQSYMLSQEEQSSSQYHENIMVFISYASSDRHIADLLCKKLEEHNIRVWYAPRDIHSGNFASAIVNAISNCSHFITIISQNSMSSEHVLNEIDLAFEQLKRNVVLLPFRIDDQDMRAEFNYYLKRQVWINAQKPPMEERIEEFIQESFGN